MMTFCIITIPILLFDRFWECFKKESIINLEKFAFSRCGCLSYILLYVMVVVLTITYYRYFPFNYDNTFTACIFDSAMTASLITYSLVFLTESLAYTVNAVYKFLQGIKNSIGKLLLTVLSVLILSAAGVVGHVYNVSALKIIFYFVAVLLGVSFLGYINTKLFEQLPQITLRSTLIICALLVCAVQLVFIFVQHMIFV